MNDKFKCDFCGDTGYAFRANLYGTHIIRCPECNPQTDKIEIKLCPSCGLYHEQVHDECNAHVIMFGKGFAAGRAAAIDEALKTIEDNLDKLTAGEIIAAIRELVPK
jgi:hypothetical protein